MPRDYLPTNPIGNLLYIRDYAEALLTVDKEVLMSCGGFGIANVARELGEIDEVVEGRLKCQESE
jgi:hypothetical protein